MTGEPVRQVSAREALENWDHYERQINRVIARANSGHDSESVLTCLQVGNMQLWSTLSGSGVCITELQTFPRYRQLLIFMVAGKDAESWLTTGRQQLEAFAIQNGCTSMVFQGRPGWEKLARKHGFGSPQVFMRKDLRNGRGLAAINDDADDRAVERPEALS